MNRWFALAVGLLVLAWVLFAYGDRARDRPSTAEGASSDAHGATTLEDQQLQHAPETSESPKITPEARLESKSAGPAPARAEAAAPKMPASGHFAELERAFASESRDVVWAREQEARIPRLVAEAGFPDDAVDPNVTCRRTLCRLQLRVTDADGFALMKLAAAVQTSNGVSLAYGDAEVVDGQTRIVVFIPHERDTAPRRPHDPPR